MHIKAREITVQCKSRQSFTADRNLSIHNSWGSMRKNRGSSPKEESMLAFLFSSQDPRAVRNLFQVYNMAIFPLVTLWVARGKKDRSKWKNKSQRQKLYQQEEKQTEVHIVVIGKKGFKNIRIHIQPKYQLLIKVTFDYRALKIFLSNFSWANSKHSCFLPFPFLNLHKERVLEVDIFVYQRSNAITV